MMDTPRQRQEQIMNWLKAERSLAPDELAARLKVSVMTVHRDLDQLATTGQVQKGYGAAELVVPKPAHKETQACALCQMDVSPRTAFTIQTAQKSYWACCAHCGLLLLAREKNEITSALTRDFLYGHMVNAMQAIYVASSRVHLCCVPSLLTFTGVEDANDFMRGFGGMVMDFGQVTAHLGDHHHHHSTS